jgi:hypothetical protein
VPDNLTFTAYPYLIEDTEKKTKNCSHDSRCLVTIRTQFSPSLHICTYDKNRNEYGVLVWKSEEKKIYEDAGVRGRIILKWLLKTELYCVDWINLSK